MIASECGPEAVPGGKDYLAVDGGVVELTFLLPRDQLWALERMAGEEGITVARLLRRMIRNHLSPRMIDSGRAAKRDDPADERSAQ